MPVKRDNTSSGSVSILGVAIRDLARLNKVAVTVARHGFGSLLERSPIRRLLFKDREVPEGDAELMSKPAAVRFRRLLEALGPTYIKLGQILSMRRDLLSADYIHELEQLQDKTPTRPFEEMAQVIEEGLGLPVEDLFAGFEEEPLGTASIAQTYRATTHDGDAVVIKVQRPGIEGVMRGDLDLLYLGAKILEATIDEMAIYSPSNIVVEFERALVQELDFSTELNNLVTARTFLDPEGGVIVPRPYPELSSRTVLTMEFFEGRPIRDLERGSERAREAVETVLHAGLKQVLHDGFFHGDPHPGNIMINDDDVVCMIDLGMMGSLSTKQREDLVTLILAAIANDTSTLARTLLSIGTPTRRINMAEFKAEIDRIRGEHLVVQSFGEYDSTAFSQAFVEAANRYGIKLASEYSVLVKASATIEGIIRDLAPDVDLIAIAQ
ncbi:MAG: ABC transporter, partial [Myxococcales bacterium]|nr:ABC transporter [Myxococcales bacterium]